MGLLKTYPHFNSSWVSSLLRFILRNDPMKMCQGSMSSPLILFYSVRNQMVFPPLITSTTTDCGICNLLKYLFFNYYCCTKYDCCRLGSEGQAWTPTIGRSTKTISHNNAFVCQLPIGCWCSFFFFYLCCYAFDYRFCWVRFKVVKLHCVSLDAEMIQLIESLQNYWFQMWW